MQHTQDTAGPQAAGSRIAGRSRRDTGGPAEGGRTRGLGRIIVMVYAVFALSAFARSLFQVLTQFEQAPVAYLLSVFAAVVYIVATVSLALPGPRAWAVAMGAVTVELVGVIGVGAATLLAPELFADETVWSRFGAGYGWIPLVLPIVGVIWLWRHRPGREVG